MDVWKVSELRPKHASLPVAPPLAPPVAPPLPLLLSQERAREEREAGLLLLPSERE